MLKLYPFYSSSSGNMYLLSSENTNILVDIGVTYKKVCESLISVNKSVSDIDALFITHEHTDHIQGLAVFINNNPNIPVYLTEGTKNYILTKLISKLKVTPNFKVINYGQTIDINNIFVTSIETSHDAIEPTSYYFKTDSSSITIATDLGYMTDNVYNSLTTSDFSVIESNYDKNLLMYGPYSYSLKRRIDSKVGHLSNNETAETLVKLASIGKRNFLLAHISENNNTYEQVLNTVHDTILLNGYDLNEFNINIATKEFSNEVYEI